MKSSLTNPNVFTRCFIALMLAAFFMPVSYADSLEKSKVTKPGYFRAMAKLSRSVDPAPSSSIAGVYNKRTGTVRIIENTRLSIAINDPGSQEEEVVWMCDIDVFCCVDIEPSGCTDFIFACDDFGGDSTTINGGQGGTCDCSDQDGNGHPQC